MPLKIISVSCVIAAACLLIHPTTNAEDYIVGDLTIVNPHTRATPPGARTAAGFAVIRNTGDSVDRLIGGSAEFAEITEVHEMSMHGDVMKMRQLEDGLEIPPGAEVALQPGGLHMMYMQIKQQLMAGEQVTATFSFEKAGEVEVTMIIVPIGGADSHGSKKHGDKKKKHGDMGHGEMKHGDKAMNSESN